jgi:hypothetical protein
LSVEPELWFPVDDDLQRVRAVGQARLLEEHGLALAAGVVDGRHLRAVEVDVGVAVVVGLRADPADRGAVEGDGERVAGLVRERLRVLVVAAGVALCWPRATTNRLYCSAESGSS